MGRDRSIFNYFGSAFDESGTDDRQSCRKGVNEKKSYGGYQIPSECYEFAI